MLIAVVLALQSGFGNVPTDTCLEVGGRRACENLAQHVAQMGVKTIEAEAADGVEVYRVRFIDGYGRDLPVVAFVRRPGESPSVEVSASAEQKLVSPVSDEVWRKVRSESRYVDRELVPLKGAEEGICLHSWVAGVEMANTQVDIPNGGRVRKIGQSTCNGGMAIDYGFKLVSWARSALPPCDMVEADKAGGDIGALTECLRFKGDRAAAASLYNARHPGIPLTSSERGDAAQWRAVLGVNGPARLSWDGQEAVTDQQGTNAVAEFLVGRVISDPGLTFESQSYRGLTGRRGEISGVVRTGDNRTANYLQTWVWDPNMREWMLESWTVEAFSSTD